MSSAQSKKSSNKGSSMPSKTKRDWYKKIGIWVYKITSSTQQMNTLRITTTNFMRVTGTLMVIAIAMVTLHKKRRTQRRENHLLIRHEVMGSQKMTMKALK
jgi:hypothetical protein